MLGNTFLYLVIGILTILVVKEYYEIRKINTRLLALQRINKAFYFVGNQVNEVKTKEELYRVILSAAVDLVVCADKGSILILEEDGKFHFKATKGFSENLKNLTLEREEVFLYRVNNFTSTAIIENPAKFDEKNMSPKNKEGFDKYDDLNITTTISSPIYVDNRLVGVINVDSIRVGRVFTNNDIEAMNHIKNQLQVVLKSFINKAELRHMAHHDYLTGIYNRRIFNYFLIKEIQKSQKDNSQLNLVLIDIDNFKKINDEYGHIRGDEVLKIFTEILKRNIKEKDICGRIAGDEFVILFKNSSEEQIKEILTNTKEILSEVEVDEIKISFSYGVCKIEPTEDLTIEEIYDIADKNMYKDKAKKKEI